MGNFGISFGKLTKKMAIEVLLGGILILAGLYLLILTYTSPIFTEVQYANVWARRFYTILALASVSLGYSLSWTGTARKIVAFFMTFILLNGSFLLFGGVFSFDAANPNYQNFWIVYDTSFKDVAVGIKVIGDAATNIVPLILLCLIVYQVLYAGDSSESTKSILEGAICLAFVLAFNFVGGLNITQLMMVYNAADLSKTITQAVAIAA